MIQDAIIKIVQKEDLSYEESYAVMNEIMSGQTTPTQNAAFLAALSTKSTRAETIDEISGCAAAMRDHAIKFDANGLETLGDRGHRRRRRPQHQHLLHRRHCDRRCRSARSPSTAMWPPPPRAAQPMCWRRWASTSSWSPPRWSRCFREPGSASCTLRSTTPL